MHRRFALFAAAAGICLASSLAGCGSSTHGVAAPTPTTAPTPPTAPRATTPATAAPTVPPTTEPAAGTCTVSDLHISVTAPTGSAGALHYRLVFENVSSSPCTLYGFPGVSFLDRRGDQIGPPAQEGSAQPRHSVTLVPGRLLLSGYARLDVTDPGIPPCAGPGTVAEIRVYPPASYTAVQVAPPAGMQVCRSANTANYIASTVGPITPTSSPD